MGVIAKSQFNAGRYNNYLIGGNICNAFALGTIGSTEDFFLIGAEPPGESSYPVLTGNILDSEGNVLFRLVQNSLIINPGNCSKIVGDQLGYEIHDSAGEQILKVATEFQELRGQAEQTFVTTIAANFYDSAGRLVFRANSGEEGEQIEADVKQAYGFSGAGFGFVAGMTQEDKDVAKIALSTRGAIHQRIKGEVTGGTIQLDGKALCDAHIHSAKIIVERGDFAMIGSRIESCDFEFRGAAARLRWLVNMLNSQQDAPGD